MKGQTVIIIGTDSDIVYQVATKFLKRGARVICTCHNKDKADIQRHKIIQETGNKRIVIKLVNLTSMECVRKFADCINNHLRKLDIIVNLADSYNLPRVITSNALETTMQVNYFSPFLLINLLLELLKKSGPSRIILTTTKIAKYGKVDIENLNHSNGSFTVYSRAKLCTILFAKELSERLSQTDVSVSCVDLELVDTDFHKKLPMFVRKLLDVARKSEIKGADSIVNEATMESPRGTESVSEALTKKILKYDQVKSKLWNITEILVELSQFPSENIS